MNSIFFYKASRFGLTIRTNVATVTIIQNYNEDNEKANYNVC